MKLKWGRAGVKWGSPGIKWGQEVFPGTTHLSIIDNGHCFIDFITSSCVISILRNATCEITIVER